MVKKKFLFFSLFAFLTSCSTNNKNISFILPTMYRSVNYLSYLAVSEESSEELKIKFPLISSVSLKKRDFKSIEILSEEDKLNLNLNELNLVKEEESSFSYILDLSVKNYEETITNLDSFTYLNIETNSNYSYKFPVYLLSYESNFDNDITLNLIDINLNKKNNLKHFELTYLFNSNIDIVLYNFSDSKLNNFPWYNSEVYIYDSSSKDYKYATSSTFSEFKKDITYYITLSFYESSKVYYFNENIPFRFLKDEKYINLFAKNLLDQSLIKKLLLQ